MKKITHMIISYKMISNKYISNLPSISKDFTSLVINELINKISEDKPELHMLMKIK